MHTRQFVAQFLLLTPVLATASMVSAADVSKADNWLQWRGPSRDSQVQTLPWPESLDETRLQRTWRVPLGPSYSGPIVTADRVISTETKDAQSEVVRAFDRKTGKQLWEASWEGAMKVPFFARSNGDWIRATPASDGERLYVAGMRDVLVCIDVASGEVLWKRDFVKEMKTKLPSFGFASSPMVLGDSVYVQAGEAFLKLNKFNGKLIWQTLKGNGGMYGSAFSSPVMASIQDTPQILVQTRSALTGVDPESGTVLWSRDVPAFRGMNILTPTVTGNRIFTSSYGGKSLMFDASKSNAAWSVEEAWVNKAQAYMSSPVLIDDHIYVHLRNQRFTCIDLETGETRWTTKPFGKYWSMVANGDKILALDERGELLLVRANPEAFDLIDKREVSEEETWAHLAVVGDEVFIRELNALSAFSWK